MNEMDRLADLGVALRPSQAPQDRLAERVAAELAAAIAAPAPAAPPPAARRLRLRPALAAASVTAAAAGLATAMMMATSGAPAPGGPTPAAQSTHGATASNGTTVRTAPAAFTVTANTDGSVTFTARDLVDAQAATQALHQAGLAGRVINQQAAGTCPNGGIHAGDTDPNGTALLVVTGNPVTLHRSDYPAGGGLLVTVAGTGNHVAVGVFAFTRADRIPTCTDWYFTG